MQVSFKSVNKKWLVRLFSVTEAELQMVNLRTLKSNIPEINSAIREQYIRNNIGLITCLLLPAIFLALANSFKLINDGNVDNNFYRFILNIANLLIILVFTICNRLKLRDSVYFCPMVYTIFQVISIILCLQGYIPDTKFDHSALQWLNFVMVLKLVCNLVMQTSYYHAIWMQTLLDLTFYYILESKTDLTGNAFNREMSKASCVTLVIVGHVYVTQLKLILIQAKAYLAGEQNKQLNNLFNSHSDGILICSNKGETDQYNKKLTPRKLQNQNKDQNQTQISELFHCDVQVCNEAFQNFTNVSLKDFKELKYNCQSGFPQWDKSGDSDDENNHQIDFLSSRYQLLKKKYEVVANLKKSDGIISTVCKTPYQKKNSAQKKLSLIDILANSGEFEDKGKILNFSIEGKTKQMRVMSCKLQFNDQQCNMFTFQDITHLYQLEEEKNKNLTLSILSASISHEMLTPVSCIISLTQNCLKIIKDSQCQTIMKKMICSGKLLRFYLQNLLDNSIIEANKLEPTLENQNVELSIKEVIDVLEFQAQTKSIKIRKNIHKELKTSFLFDQKRMQQVLINLVSNAIKFSQNGSAIVVDAKLNYQQNQIKIQVTDQGVGINENEKDKIFESFFKSQNQTNRKMNPSGNGLGLYISRKICRALGGDLTVESNSNSTTFKMSIYCKHINQEKFYNANHLNERGIHLYEFQSQQKNYNEFSCEETEFKDDESNPDRAYQNYGDSSVLEISHTITQNLEKDFVQGQSDTNNSQRLIEEEKNNSQMANSFAEVVSDDQEQSQKMIGEVKNPDFDSQNILGLQAEEVPQLENLIENENYLLKYKRKRKEQGLILIADDQVIVIESIKHSIQRIKALDVTEFYFNGQQVIDRVKFLTKTAIQSAKCFPICPVRIVLLDFQMPEKNGLEVVIELKNFYDDLIVKYDQILTADLFIQQPIFIFLTAHAYNRQFLEHARSKGVKFFFEKPLNQEKLKYLLKLIRPESVNIFRQF